LPGLGSTAGFGELIKLPPRGVELQTALLSTHRKKRKVPTIKLLLNLIFSKKNIIVGRAEPQHGDLAAEW
jgi:hypothetical protein